MWVILGIALTLAGIYLYQASTCFFTEVTFMTAYEVEIKVSNSHELGLRAAMNVFRGRHPFNVLTDDELERALRVLSLNPHARLVAKFIRSLDRKKDASLLANQLFLNQLEVESLRLREAGK